MCQRRAAVLCHSHGNHHLIDVHFKFVLMFGDKMMKRKYDLEYLKCAFSYIEDKKGQKPQCVICSEMLATESMKPSKLKSHLETKHPACKEKSMEFFQRWLQELRTSQKCLTASCSKQEQALRTSYHVGHRAAKAKSWRAYFTCRHGHGKRCWINQQRTSWKPCRCTAEFYKSGSQLNDHGKMWVPEWVQLRTPDLHHCYIMTDSCDSCFQMSVRTAGQLRQHVPQAVIPPSDSIAQTLAPNNVIQVAGSGDASSIFIHIQSVVANCTSIWRECELLTIDFEDFSSFFLFCFYGSFLFNLSLFFFFPLFFDSKAPINIFTFYSFNFINTSLHFQTAFLWCATTVFFEDELQHNSSMCTL